MGVCRYAWDVISEWQSRLGGDLGARLATVPPQVCQHRAIDWAQLPHVAVLGIMST